ncbi:MAG TPA: aldehyde dehydrogenase family protein, partial [Nitrospirota bacterium]|nr:aldehyde dehydrogenase family protein [Nitrospirota bacterium]
AGERAAYLFKVAEMMKDKRFELTALQIYEVGKSWKEADGDVSEAIDYLEYYGREMQKVGSGYYGNYPGEVNDYHYVPRGIGIIISPWNFPLAIPTGMVAASIVTGNCAIFKPSGFSPVTAWKLVEFFKEAGLPPGVLQYLPGPGNIIGDYLVSHPGIDFITFTGSKDVGLRIVGLASDTIPGQRNVKRVIAEMGGKNAIIVDETADLDEAIKGVIESGFGYQGQKCSACSRVIVLNDIYAEFCERLKDAAESIRIGPPERPGNFMGPVIDSSAHKKIIEYIEIGKDEGKPHIINPINISGNFIGPVLFEDVEPEAIIAQEEIFGPVIAIIRADDLSSALEIANSTEYALTAGIFSRSPVNIQKAREGLRAGNIYINRPITGALVGRQPFGGFGMSGIGSKAGSPEYLLQFMHPVCISENVLRKGFAPT